MNRKNVYRSHIMVFQLLGEKILMNLIKYDINVKYLDFNAYGIFKIIITYQGMLSIYLSQIQRNSMVKVTDH